jgi:two-component system KDP operon response regulator KdpE
MDFPENRGIGATGGGGLKEKPVKATKVLIVDDNRDLAHALSVRLRANHYNIVTAEDGVSATALALAERPAAIIMDLSLPDGDGIALLKKFQSYSELAAVPVIVVTADCSARKKRQVMDAGAWAFLGKPTDYQSLLATLREIQQHSPKPIQSAGEPDSKTPRVSDRQS